MAKGKGAAASARDAEERGKDRLAATVVFWIRAVAFVLGLTVAFLEVTNAPLDRLTRTFDNAALMKLGLVVFFFGWLWGATADTEIQSEGYCRDPKKGRIGLEEAAGIIVFIAVFSLLFVLHDRLVWFQVLLLVFIIVNTWTWRIIFRRTIPMIEASYVQFAERAETRDAASLAKLLLVVQYMNGPWQRRRFISLISLAAVQVGVALLVSSGSLASLVAGSQIKGVPADVLLGYLPGTLFILYVLISEIWMKMYRIKIFADLSTVDYLDSSFAIGRRRGPPPAPHLAPLSDFTFTPNPSYSGHGPLDWFIRTE